MVITFRSAVDKATGTHQLHASPDAEKRRALHHPELKEYEDKVLTSKGKALALKNSFMKSCSTCCCRIWKRCTERERAGGTRRAGEPGGTGLTLNYTCPTFIDKPGIRITEGAIRWLNRC